MPYRKIAAKEMAVLLGVLSHPERLQIVEELRAGELDVATLQDILGISQAKTSRHLGVLRAHRLVAERPEGRHVYYRLVMPELAAWVAGGLAFIEQAPAVPPEVREAAEQSRALWLGDRPPQP